MLNLPRPSSDFKQLQLLPLKDVAAGIVIGSALALVLYIPVMVLKLHTEFLLTLLVNTSVMAVLWARAETVGIPVLSILRGWNESANSLISRALRYWGIYLLLMTVFFCVVSAGVYLLQHFGWITETMIGRYGDIVAARSTSAERTLILGPAGIFWFHIVGSLAAPVFEETLFRRILYVWCRQRMPFGTSLAINAVVFGLVHGTTAVQTGVVGILFCIAYERERSLPVNILLHSFVNITVSLVRILSSFW